MWKFTRSALRDLSSFLPKKAVERGLTLDETIDAFTRYYREVEYARCDRANDGDMLLFQYGVYDWGDGPSFEVDFVRQFMVERFFQQPLMEQLHLTLFFKPELGSDLQDFNLWSSDCPDIERFAQQVRESPGFKRAASQPAANWKLLHELV
jgi:hypothetical protein